MSDPRDPSLLDALRSGDFDEIEADAVPDLIALLDDESGDPEIRSGAAEALGDLALRGSNEAQAAIPSLRRALHDPNTFVRSDSATALGYLRDAGALEELMRLVEDDPHEWVRTCAAAAMPWAWTGRKRGARGLVARLSRVLTDPETLPDVRDAVAGTLEKIRARSRAARSALSSALDDSVPEVRFSAARGLGRVGTPELLPALDRMAATDTGSTPFGTVADEAARAAQAIRRRYHV